MFNFSANNLTLVKTIRYDKSNVHILQDNDTKRSYKVYDYKKVMEFEIIDIPLCLDGTSERGRGIPMTRLYCGNLFYNKKGNKATLIAERSTKKSQPNMVQ